MSVRNDECCARKGPSRRVSIPAVEPGPRKTPSGSSVRAQLSRNGWSIRLRPTWSLVLAAPDISSSLAFSTEWAART